MGVKLMMRGLEESWKIMGDFLLACSDAHLLELGVVFYDGNVVS